MIGESWRKSCCSHDPALFLAASSLIAPIAVALFPRIQHPPPFHFGMPSAGFALGTYPPKSLPTLSTALAPGTTAS